MTITSVTESIEKSVKRLGNDYELKRLGLLDPALVSYPRLALGGLIYPAWGTLRLYRALRRARKSRTRILHNLAWLRANPLGPNDWGISCPYQLGDVYLYSMLAKSLMTYHGAERVIFFTKPQHAFISRLFPSVAAAVAVSPPFKADDIGEHDCDRFSLNANKGQLFLPNFFVTNMLGYGDLTLIDCFRANFRVPAHAELEKPRLPSASELARAHDWLIERGLKPGHLIILCPDASSTPGLYSIPDAFWQKLIPRLRKHGFEVVTNVGGPARRVLEGAPALQIPLESFRAIACAAGCVISNRSGISDILSDLPLQLAVLFPVGTFHCSNLFHNTSLRAMGLSETAIETEIGPHNQEDVLDLLTEQLQSPVNS